MRKKLSIKILVTITCLLIVSLTDLSAQNIANADLVWKVVEAKDLQTQNQITYNAEIKTYGTNSVQWIQKKGQLTTTFTVDGIEGTWTDVSQAGTMTYLLSRNGNTCKMIVEKNSTGIFITLDFSKPGEYTSVHKFNIQSVQTNN